MQNKAPSDTDNREPLSRRDYQEILLARMAGGDLYANEERLKIRAVDMALDRLRIVCGEKPLYEGSMPSNIRNLLQP